jgi:hypothetical protein
MKRRDVIPEAKRKHLMAQGQLKGVSIMQKETEARLTEAYEIGFNEASTKAHVIIPILAISALHDMFGFGEARAKRFAERLEVLMGAINAGEIQLSEIVSTLIEEKITFIRDVDIEDGQGNHIVIKLDDIAEKGIKKNA